MILRPVNPVSPWGPPITNLPVGFTWYLISLLKSFAYFLYFALILGIRILITSDLILASILASESKSSCWVEITIASIRTGWFLSLYSSVTWLFASGRR